SAAAIASGFFGDEAGPKLATVLRQGEQALKRAEAAVAGIFSEQVVRDAQLLKNAWSDVASVIGVSIRDAFVRAAASASEFFRVIDEADRLEADMREFGEATARVLAETRDLEERRRALHLSFVREGRVQSIGELEQRQQLLERLANARPTPFAERQRQHRERQAAAAEAARL